MTEYIMTGIVILSIVFKIYVKHRLIAKEVYLEKAAEALKTILN